MRISDWSSDVCSSDLFLVVVAAAEHDGQCPFAGSTEQLLGELGAARRDAQAETAASIAAQLREITYCAISVDDEFEIEQRKAAAACERSGKEIGRAHV